MDYTTIIFFALIFIYQASDSLGKEKNKKRKVKKLMHDYVTCGSSLKLVNNEFNVRLHSHEVKYGQGSGQQSVTGVTASDDTNSYWQVRARASGHCIRGNPVKCGQHVRLTHLATQKNLHCHHFASPLSNNLEVSAFGENGEGDEGDEWTVECSSAYWERSNTVRLKHTHTDSYLHVSGEKFGRPIAGQMEICGVHQMSRSNQWLAAEGIYVKPNTERNITDDDEDSEEGENTNPKPLGGTQQSDSIHDEF